MHLHAELLPQLRREGGERMNEETVVEMVRIAIGSVHDHAKWAGEEIARLQFENDKLNEDIDYFKDQLDSLKTENAALRKKCAKAVEE